jgi:hypothetical protein
MSRAVYTGSCQCGSIAFEVNADLDHTLVCNCSRCRRLGSVLTFVQESDFHLLKDGPTSEYLFNKAQISHRFCPVCGIQTHAYGEQQGVRMVAVNVNCLDGVEARKLNAHEVDGATR